jgi:hypothetical protein
MRICSACHGRSEFADLRRLEPDSPLVAELKTLTRDQDSLIQMQTRLVNQLTACLKAYYPVALSLFSKLHQRSTLHFLQAYPTPQAAMAASHEHLTSVLKQAGHPTPEQTAAKLVETLHQPALHADEVTTRTKSRLMLALVRQLEPVMEEIAKYDREIERLFLTHADSCLIRSLPRAGKRLAPRLLAELGEDRRRYQNAASLQALAGTSPVPFESGKYAKPHRRYACIKPLRNALQQFARAVLPRPKLGRRTTTTASGPKAKAIVWRCARWRTSGVGSSLPCGPSGRNTSELPSRRLNDSTLRELPE